MSDIIYHKHHIVPRHAGGADDPSNIVKLTVEEHAEAHRVLYEKHGRWQDKLAWKTLSGMIDKQEAIKEIQYQNGKKNGSLPCKWKGKKRPYEFKDPEARLAKISMALTGRKQSEETKQKRAEKLRGKKRSPETIEKMKKAHQNRKPVSEESRRRMSESAKRRYIKTK